MTDNIEKLMRSWDEPAVCQIEYPDGKMFSTAGHSWLECAWNAVLEAHACSRKLRANNLLVAQEILTIEMARHPFTRRKVWVGDVIVWARRTGLYSELSLT